MSEKVKLRDLAQELELQPKELLAQLKGLGIQGKTQTSTLSEEEATKIRGRLGKAQATVRSDVIVRRRKEAPAEVEAPATDAALAHKKGDAPEEAPAEAEAPKEVKKGRPRKEKAPEPPVEEVLPAPAEEPAKPKKGSPARVISRPELPKPALTPASVQTQAPAPAPTPEEIEEPLKKRPARPASLANLSAEPERNAEGEAVSSVPVLAPRPDEEGEAARFDLFADKEEGEEEGGRRRSPGAHHRPPKPESSGAKVRVISRPDPGAAPSGPAHHTPGVQRRSDVARPSEGRPPFRPDYQNRGAGRPGGGDARRPAPGPRGSFTPAAVPPPPLPGAEGDASRKRHSGKGKRTVNFGEGADSRRFKDEGEGLLNRGQRRGKGRKGMPEVKAVSTQPLKAAKRKIRVDEFIRVADLAHQMGLKSNEIIKVLFNLGVMATINQTLDVDTATLVAAEFDYEVEKVGFSEQDFLTDAAENPEDLVIRPPVVTIMGHVDHGKTSLLDAIRKTSVTSGEAGGITQHIGAYHVKTKKGEIVFLDTPGHAAFTAMRARGAQVTDIVVLVVAADDGVMDQTKEAISHAKAAGVPIMVAVNKIDKPTADLDRVKRELADNGLVSEDWGGDVVFSYVSAKTRQGLDDFLELLALQAEILELKANPNRAARGHIVEAKLDKGRGSLGTVLIQQGTLKVGDPFVCGVHYGRVRAMFDDQGRKVKEAGPSMPIEVQGFEGVPEAGEEFVSLPDEKTARRIADARAMKQREKDLARESKITLESFLASSPDSVEVQTLNLLIKADVQGSVEAIVDAMLKLSTEKVRINIVHSAAGAISESDVLLAAASRAVIIGFNVRPTPKTKELAEQEKVDIRYYDIIYKLVEEITSAMKGMLAPVEKEVYLGSAEVRETFSVPKVGVVAGSFVTDGKFVRNSRARLLRDGVVVHTGRIGSLRRFKDDVKEVLKDYECGIGLENYNDVKVGDVIEAFDVVEEAASL